jgi:hypothetical protein
MMRCTNYLQNRQGISDNCIGIKALHASVRFGVVSSILLPKGGTWRNRNNGRLRIFLRGKRLVAWHFFANAFMRLVIFGLHFSPAIGPKLGSA